LAAVAFGFLHNTGADFEIGEGAQDGFGAEGSHDDGQLFHEVDLVDRWLGAADSI
jgi:hypothetical protein